MQVCLMKHLQKKLYSFLGEGMDKLLELIKESAIEFEKDYKVEWERIRLEKIRLQENNKDISHSEGKPVPLITEASISKELGDIYIKHPGDNDDEESDEGEEIGGMEKDENEEESFTEFVEKHKKKITKKIQSNS